MNLRKIHVFNKPYKNVTADEKLDALKELFSQMGIHLLTKDGDDNNNISAICIRINVEDVIKEIDWVNLSSYDEE